ncbi:MAG: hypothetical protein U0232_25060 [Thermomicrobiales bacterium]
MDILEAEELAAQVDLPGGADQRDDQAEAATGDVGLDGAGDDGLDIRIVGIGQDVERFGRRERA